VDQRESAWFTPIGQETARSGSMIDPLALLIGVLGLALMLIPLSILLEMYAMRRL